MLTDDQKALALGLMNTSVSDLEIKMMLKATSRPVDALADVAATLHYMNARNIGKISHRRGLIKAGRKALAVLGEA